jgi:hypothetical protein
LRRFVGGTQLPHAETIADAAAVNETMDFVHPTGFQSFKEYAASRTLIEHWNGKNWKIISSPNAGAERSRLCWKASRIAAALAARPCGERPGGGFCTGGPGPAGPSTIAAG